jgi:hypothetical protein
MVAPKKLDLFNQVLPAIDRKDYNFYDNLTDEQKKEFKQQSILHMRWGCSLDVDDRILQHYYVASFNHRANKNFFNVYNHPKLQWLLIAASSPKLGKYRRKWLGKKKAKDPKDDIKKQLANIYPTYKEEDLEVLSNFVTKKELKQYDKDRGN